MTLITNYFPNPNLKQINVQSIGLEKATLTWTADGMLIKPTSSNVFSAATFNMKLPAGQPCTVGANLTLVGSVYPVIIVTDGKWASLAEKMNVSNNFYWLKFTAPTDGNVNIRFVASKEAGGSTLVSHVFAGLQKDWDYLNAQLDMNTFSGDLMPLNS